MTDMVISGEVLDRAVAVIANGGVVAFPTETYYGLAVDPFNEVALDRLFEIKRRPEKKPVLVLIAERSQLSLLTGETPPLFAQLVDRFWPGPLTLVFDALPGLSSKLCGGMATVGVRISSHPVARLLTARAGRPITATSANISGIGPAVNAAEVREQFGDLVDLVLDGGATPGEGGSTVVGIENGMLRLIREGVIPFVEVREVVGGL